MANLTITVEYEENGVTKTQSEIIDIDQEQNMEYSAIWVPKIDGGYKLEGVGGRPNDRE